MKHQSNQPPELAARVNQIVEIYQILLVPEPRSATITHHTSYPGKPKNIYTELRPYLGSFLGRGMYLGDSMGINAFVWLDEEEP